jgi:hypothetical protein
MKGNEGIEARKQGSDFDLLCLARQHHFNRLNI